MIISFFHETHFYDNGILIEIKLTLNLNLFRQCFQKDNFFMVVGKKRSYILKQTCYKKLQVCLSMYDVFLPSGMNDERLMCFMLYLLYKIMDSYKLIPFDKNIATLKFFHKSAYWQSNDVFSNIKLEYANLLVSLCRYLRKIICKMFCKEPVFGLYF